MVKSHCTMLREYSSCAPMPNKGVALDPRFSPDGKYILLKIGAAFTEYDRYWLYVLDLHTRQVRLASSRGVTDGFRHISWSPGGKYLAYVSGGTGSHETEPVQLRVREWRTGHEQLVTGNPGAALFNAAWADSSKFVACEGSTCGTEQRISTLERLISCKYLLLPHEFMPA